MSTQAVAERRRTVSPVRRRSGVQIGKWSLRAVAIVYLGALVILPISVVIAKGFGGGLQTFRDAMSTPGATAAIKLTLITAVATAVINAFFGTLLAFVLVRFRFWGRGLLSSIVDLPFAVPTLVTGVMLVALYGPASPIGRFLEDIGLQVAFAPLGVLFALLFVTLPFVVRTVQPVLSELDPAEEEAAASLGARGTTTFRRIVLPALRPAILGGALLAFARALGEFGAIVIISGNISGETLTAPVYIFQLASQFQPEQAAAIATLLFGISFLMVLFTERILMRRRDGK